MGFFDKEKTSSITVKSPSEIFTDMLKVTSGTSYARNTEFDIFYQIVAFKGICDGVGTSTLVANTAIAISKLGLTVCVIDASVLNPVQDVLLRTNWKDKELKNRKDWFDIMYTDDSVLHQSKISSNISVLSFKGKKRDITDLMGTQDTDLLVETALSILHNKFDIILIDCCQETTQINAACIQQAQKVIQVWSDTPHIISNIDMWITNNVILSCPLDKMRYVVISKFVNDIRCDFSGMLSQYRFTQLASCSLSIDVARVNAMGKDLWGYASESEEIQEFNNCIIDIVCHLLNIEDAKEEHRGSFTSNDIDDGKVDGTLHKKMQETDKNIPDIHRTLEEADNSLDSSTKPRTSGLEAYQINTNENSVVESYMQEYSENVDDTEEINTQDSIETDNDSKPKKSKLFGRKRG